PNARIHIIDRLFLVTVHLQYILYCFLLLPEIIVLPSEDTHKYSDVELLLKNIPLSILSLRTYIFPDRNVLLFLTLYEQDLQPTIFFLIDSFHPFPFGIDTLVAMHLLYVLTDQSMNSVQQFRFELF